MWREPPENWEVGRETSRGKGYNSLSLPSTFRSSHKHTLISSSLSPRNLAKASMSPNLTENEIRTGVENRPRKLNVTKVSRTFRHPLTTSLTLKVPIDGPQARIHQPAHLWLVSCFVHYFRVFNFRNGVRFLLKMTWSARVI